MFDGLRLLQLGNDPGFKAKCGNPVAHQAHVLGCSHKRDCNRINAVLQCKLQILGVFLRKRWNPHKDPRQIDAFVLAEHAAVDHVARHIVAYHLANA